jgi:DNA primase
VARKVVLVFDADAGGDTGVERAMEVFVSHDVDLRIAALPQGLDPCDLLVQEGPDPFRQALETATDVFEYQLQRVWAKHETDGVEGRRRAADELLTVMAAAPDERSVKLELMINRIAHRLQVKEETLWARLRELRAKRKAPEREAPRPAAEKAEPAPALRQAPAPPHERELIELLLADPALVATAQDALTAEEVEHPGLRRLLEGLYELRQEGRQPDLDQLLGRLDNERLSDSARKLQDRGLDHPDRPGYLQKVLGRFRDRREARRTQSIKNQIKAALEAGDQETALALQRQLRTQPDR